VNKRVEFYSRKFLAVAGAVLGLMGFELRAQPWRAAPSTETAPVVASNSSQAPNDSPDSVGFGLGAQILSDAQGVSFDSYALHLLDQLHKNWDANMPEGARMGEKGKSRVVITILPDGKLSAEGPLVESSSGNRRLDKASVNAIRHSLPFDPLPQQFHRDSLKLRVFFFYSTKPDADELKMLSRKN
jgi:outer membrane biosynthesis protein TonB